VWCGLGLAADFLGRDVKGKAVVVYGIPGLKKVLLGQSEQFVGTVTERLLMYAMGRNLQYYDAPTVRAVMHEAKPANYSFTSLVLGIVKSRPFQMREAGVE